jgi:hypothetical protein
LEGLPQYQPTVNRVSRVLVHDETILTLCVTNVHKNVSISIDFASIDTEREAQGHRRYGGVPVLR